MTIKRSLLPDGPFHVICNAVEGDVLFLDDVDRRRYMGLLQRAAERQGWQVLTFALMTTHVHLLIWAPTAGLSRGMWWLNWRYAAWCQERRHPRKGHVFGGPFRSLPIGDEPYLYAVVRYIARNPVAARMVPSAAAYRWSADRLLRTGSRVLDLLSVDRTLSFFNGYPAEYAGVVDGPDPPRHDEVARWATRTRQPRPPLADLVVAGTPEELALANTRWGYSLADLARHLGVHRSTVLRRIASG